MNRGAWLAVAASLAAVLACGSSNNGNNGNNGNANGSINGGGGFPYSGPSCSSTTINGGCWGCLQSSCSTSCITNACSDFFNCYCNCAQGDSSCYQGCASSVSPSCQQCTQSISSCEQSSCSSACGNVAPGGSGGVSSGGFGSSGSGSSGGGMVGSCVGGNGPVCASGGTIEFCTAGFNGMCTSAYYQVGNQTFPCASCSDMATCQREAVAACGPSVIDAGPPPDDVGPVPDAPDFDAVAPICHSVPCGTMGLSMEYCEVDDGAAGACTQAWYVVGGQAFYCTSCTQAGCEIAAQEASKACP